MGTTTKGALAEELLSAAGSRDLEAAWRYLQADFRVAMAKRDRIFEGQVTFLEAMSFKGYSRLRYEAQAEVDRIFPLLRAIDRIRATNRRVAAELDVFTEHGL